MSLQVDESGRRGRSRSPGRRRDENRDRSRGPSTGPSAVDAVPYPADDWDNDRSSVADGYERLSSWRPTSPTRREKGLVWDALSHLPHKYAVQVGAAPESPKQSRESLRDRERDRGKDPQRGREPEWERRYRDRDSDDDLKHRGDSGNDHRKKDQYDDVLERRDDSGKDHRKKDKYDDDLAYGNNPGSKNSPPKYSYAEAKPWENKADATLRYAPEEVRYGSSTLDSRQPTTGREPGPGPGLQRSGSKRYQQDSSVGTDPRRSSSNILTVETGAGALKPAIKRDASPLPPTKRMSSLTVNTGHHTAHMSLSSAPASPLLESYHGTYQSMSPMPSPLLLPSHAIAAAAGGYGAGQVLDAVSPIASDDERSGADKRRSRRARFHDPVDDAVRLAKALKGERRAPETEPLIEILPGLTHEQVMDLRTEYKRLVKTGSDRKGVNVAKHIRARLKDEDSSLMKACYAVALGRWESEAYWANFWYQGDKTRRELLIEALMGRTNDEIRAIKDGFSDKKYSNSLSKCMRTELKEDKFKKAVLMALEEQRMEETDGYGRPMRVDYDLVRDDVKQLYHAVRSEKGGESLMISIVVLRSDSHLRAVLRAYSDAYKANFARDALKRSGNLVGELLAHILNGVINKPVRDALLIHHALTASRKDELRRELLISRLVRYHWDRHHMAAVKIAFRERYNLDLQDAVREGTSGEWGEFCQALCISRMPDDVKKVERVEIIHR